MKSPKSLATVLQHHDLSGEAANLITHIRTLRRITQQVQSILEEPLAQHCQVANLRENIFILHTDSPAWATKLRYCLPELLPKVRAMHGLNTISSIQVKILPSQVVRTSLPTKNKPLSKISRKYLTAAADSIPDTELKAALHRLAQHGKTIAEN